MEIAPYRQVVSHCTEASLIVDWIGPRLPWKLLSFSLEISKHFGSYRQLNRLSIVYGVS
jgi:hypothetical protein